VKLLRNSWLILLIGLAASEVRGQQANARPQSPRRNEVQRAVDKGVVWLEANQNSNGYWSNAEQPAFTAMVLSTLKARPGKSYETESAIEKKGYVYLISCVQADGGIYHEELPSYNTSAALMALAAENTDEYRGVIAHARKYLASLQADYSQVGGTNSAFTGGIGYGGLSEKHPDLANTLHVLEAMYYTRHLSNEKTSPSDDLNWQAAIHFVQFCQNLPAYNTQAWASDDSDDKGGFIYAPGRSHGGQTNLASGRVGYHSYGSISYAGLLSYLYAGAKPDDERVTAALEWLRRNFNLEENPRMGGQGIYYYYFAMTKALTLCGVDKFETKDGGSINWREQLATKLIKLQKTDGSWRNEKPRWWEKDPVLTSAYATWTLDALAIPFPIYFQNTLLEKIKPRLSCLHILIVDTASTARYFLLTRMLECMLSTNADLMA
jgi:squalene-hopene/tetraprenyl-beta-curcumene cyclase